MSSVGKKIITVCSANGKQGGAVVRALLKDGTFSVRALTRNPDSEASKKLKELGVEVVKSDDTDSRESLEEVLKGSYGVFSVTQPYSYPGKEFEVAVNLAEASLKVGAQHHVFSSLPPIKKISKGKYTFSPFDDKNLAEEYIRSLSKSNPSFISSFVFAPSYYQNFFPIKNEDGSFTITLPSDPNGIPMTLGDVEDIGPIVTGIFLDPIKYSNQTLPFSGDTLTGTEIAKVFSKVTGKDVNFNYIPPNIFKTLPIPLASDIAGFCAFCSEFGAFTLYDLSIARKIHKAKTLEEYLTSINYKL